jgi:hypothetical protein
MVIHWACILLNGGLVPDRCSARRGARGAVLGFVLLWTAATGATEDARWRDLENRIQYGYYTEDSRALRNLQDALSQDEAHEALRGYYAGFVAWRLALLAAQTPATGSGSAAQLAQQCVKELDPLLEAQADFSEALALRAACQEPALGGGGMRLPFGHSGKKDLERALAQGARNPRVLLIDAASDYQRTPAQGGNRERSLVKLRKTVAAFEAERAGTEPLPGWGAAEAYVLLARNLLDHGDGVGARDALEHALLLAPDYVQARRLMQRIASG